MPLSLNFSPKPKEPAPSKSTVDRKQSKEQKDTKKRKFRSDLITLDSLRETLFLPEFKKEDDIIISFRYHTKELISISEDGKFGLKYNEIAKDCTLYHYKKPIVFDYNLEMEAILRLDTEIEIFSNIEITLAEDIMIGIIREEFAERKRLQLLGIDNAFKKEMEERRKQEEELEKIDEEYKLQEELDNIYLVPNPMMEDLFGEGADRTIEIIEELASEDDLILADFPVEEDDIYLVPNEEMSKLFMIEEQKDVKTITVTQNAIESNTKSGGLLTSMSKGSRK
jgi:hypothetical protein